MIEELERVLSGKLGFEEKRWREVEALLTELAVESVPAPQGPVEPVSGDPDEDLILACVAQAGLEVLVSGDHKHLLALGEHRGVRILTPAGAARRAARLLAVLGAPTHHFSDSSIARSYACSAPRNGASVM